VVKWVRLLKKADTFQVSLHLIDQSMGALPEVGVAVSVLEGLYILLLPFIGKSHGMVIHEPAYMEHAESFRFRAVEENTPNRQLHVGPVFRNRGTLRRKHLVCSLFSHICVARLSQFDSWRRTLRYGREYSGRWSDWVCKLLLQVVHNLQMVFPFRR
jgi:hypothetical protein